MKRIRWYCWVAVVCAVVAAWSAEGASRCRLHDLSRELPEYMVTDLLLDERGLLWLCSGNGLRCYDGYTFHHYKTRPGEDYILSSNRINRLWLSHAEGIYCLTADRNLYFFDQQTERFTDIFSSSRYAEVRNRVNEVYNFAQKESYITAAGRLFCLDETVLRRADCKDEALREVLLEREKHGNHVVEVVAGAEGLPWVVTERALLHPEGGHISIPGEVVDAVSADDNIFLITKQHQLITFHSDTETLHYEYLPMLDLEPHTLAVVSPDLLAIGTQRGLVLYAVHQHKFSYYDLRLHDGKERSVWYFVKDSRENLWIFGDDEGVVRLHLPTGRLQWLQSDVADMPATDRSSMCCCYEDRHGTVWLVPQKGHLCYYDPESETLKTYFDEPGRPESKIAPIMLNYQADLQGNLWCVTSSGLHRLTFSPANVRYVTLDGYETRALLHDIEGNLWVASKRGYIRIFRPDGTLRGFLTPSGTISSTPTLFPGNVYCFQQSENDEIWLGTRTRGLVCLNRIDQDRFRVTRYQHDPADPTSLSEDAIFALYRDRRKRLWIGTFGGGANLLQRDADGKVSFIHAGNGFTNYPISTCEQVRSFSETSDAVLIGTSEGLLAVPTDFEKPSEAQFYLNQARPKDQYCLMSNNVFSFLRDVEGQHFVVTHTGGISRIASAATATDAIRFDNELFAGKLSSDLVCAMVQDPKGRYWIQHEDAIDLYDPEMAHVTRFDEVGHHYSEEAPIFWGGKLVFATHSGLAFVDTDNVYLASHKSPIVLNPIHLQVTNERRIVDHLREVKLQKNERYVTFHFAALDYTDAAAVRYSYRLRGLDDRWSEPSEQRTATYTNLSAGRYLFEVRSTNSDGLWVGNRRELAVHVVPTFWETPWPWLIGGLLLISLLIIVAHIRLKIYRLNSQIGLEQQIANIKLRFFTDVSHELRTPLTLIASPISEVLEREKLSPRGRNHLTIVEQNTQRMLRLVNQILDLRKIESGKMKVLVEASEVRPVLLHIVDQFRPLAERNKIVYQCELPEEGVVGWLDRDKTEKIVANLLSNAFKYTPSGRGIRLEAVVEEEWLQLKVIDEGVGMDEKARQKLFRRFEALCTTSNFPSSGIGLSMVKELLDLMGGSITVESAPNLGSTFTVRLPLSRAHYAARPDTELILGDSAQPKEADSSAVSVEAPAAGQRRTTILVVEDNMELREILTDMLASEYRIVTAQNGREGLDLARQELPDLILSDVMMPEMDGLEMVRRIKEDRELCHLPIILLTAKSSLDDRIEGLEEGVDDYITKPFVANLLKIRIRTLLERYRQLRERYLEQLINSGGATYQQVAGDGESQQPHVVSSDEEFMANLVAVIENHIDNTDMTIEEFARELNMAHSTFYNKVKSLIGITPVEFIREMRLKRGHQLLQSGGYDVSTVSYMVGFSDPRYFSKCFKKRYGVSPSQLKK
ncbi:MAG: response regulator [Rikenellaceae bacterium]|nr:response regulator [Rikenellaceae bacterium]